MCKYIAVCVHTAVGRSTLCTQLCVYTQLCVCVHGCRCRRTCVDQLCVHICARSRWRVGDCSVYTHLWCEIFVNSSRGPMYRLCTQAGDASGKFECKELCLNSIHKVFLLYVILQHNKCTFVPVPVNLCRATARVRFFPRSGD